MVTLSRFLFHSASVLLLLSLPSCGDESDPTDRDTATKIVYPTGTQEIGTTGFIIDLADGFYLLDDPDAFAFYFEPLVTNEKKSGGGIYFGSTPDTTSPGVEYTERKFSDLFLGDSVGCREFSAADYYYRELMDTQRSGEFIHSWCYSKDSVETQRLWKMITGIRKK